MYIPEIIARVEPSNYIMEAIGDLYAMIRRLVASAMMRPRNLIVGGSISVRYLSPYHSFRVSLRADADLFPAVTRRALRCIFLLLTLLTLSYYSSSVKCDSRGAAVLQHRQLPLLR